MEIYFISETTGQQLQLPVLTKDSMSEITIDDKDEEFETINGTTLNLIGGTGLRSFSISSFFPYKLYNFVSLGAYKPPLVFKEFFERHRKQNLPLRVIVVDNFIVTLNMLCRCKFSYKFRDNARDMPYTLEVKEYILPAGDANV